MIQINLLPDIKRQFLKSQRVKRLMIFVAFVVSAVSIGIVVLVWLFTVGQGVHLNNVQDDIDDGLAKLQNVDDLDKVVTVQNQLAIIEELNDQKPEVALLFDYLTKITPNDIDLGSVEVDYTDDLQIEIIGLSKGFKSINVFTDVIKNATISYKDSGSGMLAFSNVVLSSAGEPDEGKTAFKIVFNFDVAVFDNNLQNLTLKVPTKTSTQSETQRPKSLFDPSAQQTPDDGQQEEGN